MENYAKDSVNYLEENFQTNSKNTSSDTGHFKTNMNDDGSNSKSTTNIVTAEISDDSEKLPLMKLNNKAFKKWQRFSEWIHCICVVTFDLELGQAMELIYPPHVQLSEQEKTNICYLAFPDSNSGCMGDTQYHIRLRINPGNRDALLSESHRYFNSQCIPVQKADTGHYWGFVYFRQTKDVTLPRGYFQKSFIILTRLPFFNLYYEICTLIAPRYFRDGLPLLKTIYDQICMWPPLKAGDTITLQLLDNNYQTIIPKSNSKGYENCQAFICKNGNSLEDDNEIVEFSSKSSSLSSLINDNDYLNVKDEYFDFNDINSSEDSEIKCNTDDNDDDSDIDDNNSINKQLKQKLYGPILPPQVLGSLHDIDIFRSLSSVISHIHMLWELVLIAEPIVVMGSSPADCSYMVQSLVSLISPLPYCGESRPYFTIHDSEFKEFTQQTQGSLPIIIGVTNPFFTKPLQNWPHLIRLEDQTIHHIQPVSITNFGTTAGSGDFSNSNQETLSPTGSNNIFSLSNTSVTTTSTNLRKVKSFNSKFLENSPGVYTKYKPYLQKDKEIIKKILHGIKTKRPISVQSALLRRHLLELTQSFMIPLERYIASLMPLQKDISPFKAAPSPNQFKPDDFLSSLEHSGPHLTSTLKGDWEGLYKRFFRSPNFKAWYESRDIELRQTLQALQLQALSEADLNKWAQGKHEVEIVDMILKLKNKLKLCSEPNSSSISNNTVICSSGSSSNVDSCTNCSIPIMPTNFVLSKSTRNQLLKHVENMKKSLPDDLKIILNDT